jgi:hypothetical protein
MKTNGSSSNNMPSSQPSEEGALIAEYVLIGPQADRRIVAQAFATLATALAKSPQPFEDPERTLTIPTTNVKFLRRRDGVCLVMVDGDVVAEAQPARAGGPTRLTLRGVLGAAA